MKEERVNRGLDALIPKESSGESVSKGEITRVLAALDKLLGRLPDEDVAEFSKSGDYELYVKLLKAYNVK